MQFRAEFTVVWIGERIVQWKFFVDSSNFTQIPIDDIKVVAMKEGDEVNERLVQRIAQDCKNEPLKGFDFLAEFIGKMAKISYSTIVID